MKYTFDDIREVKINGMDLKPIPLDMVEINMPPPEVTVMGKPLYPCKFLRNSDKIEIVSFDEGCTYYCSCQSYAKIMAVRDNRSSPDLREPIKPTTMD